MKYKRPPAAIKYFIVFYYCLFTAVIPLSGTVTHTITYDGSSKVIENYFNSTYTMNIQINFSGVDYTKFNDGSGVLQYRWSIPLGIPLDADIIVRVKLEFSDDGFVNNATFINTRVNERWTRHIFVLLASSALRAIVLCQPRNGYFDTAPTHLWLNLNWRKATK